MIETIKSIKKKIEWIEKQSGNLTSTEKESILNRLKEVDKDLKRYILLSMAINKQ